MAYYVPVPPAKKAEHAWSRTDSYLGPKAYLIWDSFFMANGRYRAFSFALNFIGISGWPVAALWDDCRETMRNMQS